MKPLTVEQARLLKKGDRVFIKYHSAGHNETIETYGTVKIPPTGNVSKLHTGKEYVWVSVEYKWIKNRSDKRTTVFANHHLQR